MISRFIVVAPGRLRSWVLTHQAQVSKVLLSLRHPMNHVTVTVLSAPSKSKGWGRWSGLGITSSTGNKWLYSGGAADTAGEFTIVTQTENRSKRGERTIDTFEHTLRPAPGAEVLIDHRGSPQGMQLRVTGAERAADSLRR